MEFIRGKQVNTDKKTPLANHEVLYRHIYLELTKKKYKNHKKGERQYKLPYEERCTNWIVPENNNVPEFGILAKRNKPQTLVTGCLQKLVKRFGLKQHDVKVMFDPEHLYIVFCHMTIPTMWNKKPPYERVKVHLEFYWTMGTIPNITIYTGTSIRRAVLSQLATIRRVIENSASIRHYDCHCELCEAIRGVATTKSRLIGMNCRCAEQYLSLTPYEIMTGLESKFLKNFCDDVTCRCQKNPQVIRQKGDKKPDHKCYYCNYIPKFNQPFVRRKYRGTNGNWTWCKLITPSIKD